jgi:hypothetical protein
VWDAELKANIFLLSEKIFSHEIGESSTFDYGWSDDLKCEGRRG